MSKHVFAKVQTRKPFIDIDPTTDKLLARIDLPRAAGNHGLRFEPERRGAFIAREGQPQVSGAALGIRKVTAEDP